MAQSDIKHKTLRREDIVANKNVSPETFDELELASDGSVNLLSFVGFSREKEGNLRKLSGLVLRCSYSPDLQRSEHLFYLLSRELA